MQSADSPASPISRRDAIRRAALLAGVVLSSEWLSIVDRAGPAAQGLSLDATQSAIVSAAADRILPRTDTPGAIDVGVPAFINLLYSEIMSPDERQLLTGGLATIDGRGEDRRWARVRRVERRSAGRDPARHRPRRGRPRARLFHAVSLGHDPRLLHVGRSRPQRAPLRSGAGPLRELHPNRSGRAA